MKFTSTAKSDTKELDNMFRRLQSLENYEAQYGYFEGDIHQSSGMPLPYLVELLCNGSESLNIPPRDFMGLAKDMTQQHFEVAGRWGNDVWNYLKGQGTVIQLYKQFGRVGEKYVQAAIDVGNWQQNVDWWREAKITAGNSPAPLVETKEMYESVRSKAVKRGDT